MQFLVCFLFKLRAQVLAERVHLTQMQMQRLGRGCSCVMLLGVGTSWIIMGNLTHHGTSSTGSIILCSFKKWRVRGTCLTCSVHLKISKDARLAEKGTYPLNYDFLADPTIVYQCHAWLPNALKDIVYIYIYIICITLVCFGHIIPYGSQWAGKMWQFY